MKARETYVQYTIFSINSEVLDITSTGYSPYFLMHGYNPKNITNSQYRIKLSLEITREKLNDIRQKIADKLHNADFKQRHLIISLDLKYNLNKL